MEEYLLKIIIFLGKPLVVAFGKLKVFNYVARIILGKKVSKLIEKGIPNEIYDGF